jgi:tetratricopeptide (TPR) repeat protein
MGAATPGHGAVDESLTDGNPLPLRTTGLGGAGELKKAVERVNGDDAKARFDEAFRRTFTVDKAKRDPEKARELFEALLREQPGLAEAYRGLAYVALSRGFDMRSAREYYGKALEVRPDYGEVHYALAFLYAGDDREKGAEHLRKALELGMTDEQGLKAAYGIE